MRRRLPDINRLPGHPHREFTPAQLRPWSRRRSAGAGLVVVLVGLVAVAVALLPRYVLAWDLAGAGPPANRASAVNDIRTALLQGLAGLGLLVGAVFTWRQLQLTRQGQAAERFTAAVAHLGDGNVDVRLGGMYALELIARTSPTDRDAVTDLLSAYVSRHSSVPEQTRTGWLGARQVADPLLLVGEPVGEPLSVRAPDLHAAVRVLARRRPKRGEVLHLSRVAIAGARLQFAQLARADLHYADLRSVDLIGADLREADLTGSNVSYANLSNATLAGADLRDLVCVQTLLTGADLRRTDLSGAELTGARLGGALLQQADLRGARLVDADLTEARFDGAYCDATTHWPTGFAWQAAGAHIDPTAKPIRPTNWLHPPSAGR